MHARMHARLRTWKAVRGVYMGHTLVVYEGPLGFCSRRYQKP